jgi:hypothetical protein
MRSCLMWVVLGLVGVAIVVIWPYRFEQPRLTIASNPTGCAMDVDVLSGWPKPPPVPFTVFRMNDPVEFRLNLFRCPGGPGDRPASIALMHEGKTYRGEDCGREAAEAPLSCHIALPAGPGRYRLAVQLKEGEAARPVDIEVTRETIWSPLWWDSAMGV